jgi:hypothetical protein
LQPSKALNQAASVGTAPTSSQQTSEQKGARKNGKSRSPILMARHNQKPYIVLVTTISNSKRKRQKQLNASEMQEVCKPIARQFFSSFLVV